MMELHSQHLDSVGQEAAIEADRVFIGSHL